jgi:hypothetical protein
MTVSLSKSTFLRGSQCQKSLYLHWHRPELRDPLSPMQKAIFSLGHEVGKLAQQLFPGGTDAGFYVPDQYQKSIDLTAQLIRDGQEVIYEAGFALDTLHCFTDILVKDGDGWKAYEVKSSTQMKPVNLLDAAFQYYVMTGCGLKIKDISLIVLNTAYERQGELDIRNLFRIEPVLTRVLKLQERIRKDAGLFLSFLNSDIIPPLDIGPHCTDPYDCDFRGYCWQHIPEYSVFDIAKLSGAKKWDLYRMGILKLEDIPPEFRLNDSQWQQIRAEIDGDTVIDNEEIGKFIGNLNYPLYFMDFESFQPSIPLFDNSRPYQQIVFQYSLHKKESETSALEHAAFLAKADGNDPRLPFIQSLIANIGETGDIIVFNRAFEAGRLNEIAGSFPQYRAAIDGIVKRLKDLMVLFQQRLYYVPEMRGSYSIKQVLPALVPGFSYKDLAISDGGSASMAFTSLLKETDPEKIRMTRENLLEYCKVDTLAMVEIIRAITPA